MRVIILNVESIGYRDDRLCRLKPVSFKTTAGELAYVQGANGRGKSTLLSILATLIEPTEGALFYEGKALLLHPNYRQQLFYLGHASGLHPFASVLDNIKARLGLYAVSYDRADVLKVLEELSLKSLGNTPLVALSKGQVRKVSLSLLKLVQRPLWLLDEPFASLDTPGCEWLTRQIKNHLHKGGMVVLTSHQELNGLNELNLQKVVL